jgi:hypothetical protein
MAQEYDIEGMITEIKALRRHAEALKRVCGGLPATDSRAFEMLL